MPPEPIDLSRLMAEAYRLRLMRGLEELVADSGYGLVAGVDEAGRGCLAGPVVAGAVIMGSALVPGVDDSKRLDRRQRDLLATQIRAQAVAHATVAVAADVIDRVNVLEATRLAMRQALAALRPRPQLALIDAVRFESDLRIVPVIRGDSMSYAIACASILAKTERDRLMESMAERFPGYEFDRNKGYGSQAHRRALDELGPTPIHRLTFRSVVPRREGVR